MTHAIELIFRTDLSQVISPREVSDLLDVARDKGLRLRTDKVEAMLQVLDQQQ